MSPSRLSALSVLSSAILAAMVVMVCPVNARADDTAKAKQLFGRAEKLFTKKSYEEALKLYQQAYDLKPLAGFHLNIGQCYRNLDQCDKAIEQYRLYISKSTNAKRKADTEALIKICEEELAKRPAPTAQPAPAPESKLDETPPDLSARKPEPAPAPAPAPSRRKLSPIFFWSGVGVTGALLLTGTITGAVALSKSSEFNDPNTPAADLQDLKDSGTALKTTSTVTFVLAGVAAAGTAALYFFTDFGSREHSVAAAPIEGGGMVVMGGRF